MSHLYALLIATIVDDRSDIQLFWKSVFKKQEKVTKTMCNTIQYNSEICKAPLYNLSGSANRTMQTTQ